MELSFCRCFDLDLVEFKSLASSLFFDDRSWSWVVGGSRVEDDLGGMAKESPGGGEVGGIDFEV